MLEEEQTILGNLGQQLLDRLFLLALLAVASLQPAFRGVVLDLARVLVQFGEELSNAGNRSRHALLGRIVAWWHPSQRRTRREERQQIGRKSVRHRCYDRDFPKL